MTDLTLDLPRDRFLPLPVPTRADGAPRRTGVELEFGGIDEETAARVIEDAVGGRTEPAGRFQLAVTGSDLGDLEVYLDTAFRKRNAALVAAGIELARDVLPVEIVTPPLAFEKLGRVDDLVTALREAGAKGSRSGLLWGFGLHLNPEVASTGTGHVVPVIRAFALLEDLLRRIDPIDPSRRALPFVDPYPRALVDDLAAGADLTVDALIGLYLDRAPSRNHALDALCLFKHIDEARVTRALPDAPVSARPAWHYRLPDCRIDEPDWTVAFEWNRWVLVETVAGDAALLDRLAEAWREHRAALTTLRTGWAGTAAEILNDALPALGDAP